MDAKHIFEELKEKSCQPAIQHPEKLSFKNEGKLKARAGIHFQYICTPIKSFSFKDIYKNSSSCHLGFINLIVFKFF